MKQTELNLQIKKFEVS